MVFFVFIELKLQVIVRFVDIGGTVDHHSFNFLFIKYMDGTIVGSMNAQLTTTMKVRISVSNVTTNSFVKKLG
jgi:hypothetical protein